MSSRQASDLASLTTGTRATVPPSCRVTSRRGVVRYVPSTTGLLNVGDLRTKSCTGSDLRHASLSDALPQPSARITASAAPRAASLVASSFCRSDGRPDCTIARWKRPAARGAERSAVTSCAPADCPKIVTRDGSPPNEGPFVCSHCRSAKMSLIA